MRSFKQYVNYRKNKSIIEMALDPIKFVGPDGEEREEVEIRSTPIFLDQDDIDYLDNFPYTYWKQALSIRYGKLLKELNDAKANNSEVPDIQDIQIRDSGRKITFNNVDTKINSLYEKLTGDPSGIYDDFVVTDRKTFAKNFGEKLKKERETNPKAGAYGFVLTGYNRVYDPETKMHKGVAKGWIEPDERVWRGALGRLWKALEDGWYDDDIKEKYGTTNLQKETLKRGGKGNKIVSVVPVKGKKEFTYTLPSGKKRTISAYQPALVPVVMVERRSKNIVEEFKGIVKDINEKLQNDDYINGYFQYIDMSGIENFMNSNNLGTNIIDIKKYQVIKEKTEESQKSIKKAEDSIEATSFEKKDTKKEEENLDKLKEELIQFSKFERFCRVLIEKKQFKKYFLVNLLRRHYEIEKNLETSVKKSIRDFLYKISEKLKDHYEQRIRWSERYDVHMWSTLEYSKKHTQDRPRGKLVSLGTIHPNKQQPQQYYRGMIEIFGSEKDGRPVCDEECNENIKRFWKHVWKNTAIMDEIKDAIVTKASEKGIDDSKIFNLFKKSIIEAIKEEANLELVAHNAAIQFQNKSGPQITSYARAFNESVIKNNNSTDDFMAKNTKLIKSLYTAAKTEAGNYCLQIMQLHTRIVAAKYNRKFRPENPWANNLKFEDLIKTLESFYSSNSENYPLDYQTSHSIKSVQDHINSVIGLFDYSASIDQLATQDQKASKAAEKSNKTDKEKQMNQGIAASIFAKVKQGLVAAASTASAAVSKFGKFWSSLGSVKKKDQQAQQAQSPTVDKQDQQSTSPTGQQDSSQTQIEKPEEDYEDTV